MLGFYFGAIPLYCTQREGSPILWWRFQDSFPKKVGKFSLLISTIILTSSEKATRHGSLVTASWVWAVPEQSSFHFYLLQKEKQQWLHGSVHYYIHPVVGTPVPSFLVLRALLVLVDIIHYLFEHTQIKSMLVTSVTLTEILSSDAFEMLSILHDWVCAESKKLWLRFVSK